MNMHARKMIAPIIIVVCAICYYALMVVVFLHFDLPGPIKVVGLIGSILVSLILVFVLVERMKEIRRGEEDDLGKY